MSLDEFESNLLASRLELFVTHEFEYFFFKKKDQRRYAVYQREMYNVSFMNWRVRLIVILGSVFNIFNT